jgi:hypothetical protein
LKERENSANALKAEKAEATAIQVSLGNTQANRMALPPKINSVTSCQNNMRYCENYTLLSKVSIF